MAELGSKWYSIPGSLPNLLTSGKQSSEVQDLFHTPIMPDNDTTLTPPLKAVSNGIAPPALNLPVC